MEWGHDAIKAPPSLPAPHVQPKTGGASIPQWWRPSCLSATQKPDRHQQSGKAQTREDICDSVNLENCRKMCLEDKFRKGGKWKENRITNTTKLAVHEKPVLLLTL